MMQPHNVNGAKLHSDEAIQVQLLLTALVGMIWIANRLHDTVFNLACQQLHTFYSSISVDIIRLLCILSGYFPESKVAWCNSDVIINCIVC